MERERSTTPTQGSGLSTDDLVSPPGGTPAEESEGRSEAPAFPGEATGEATASSAPAEEPAGEPAPEAATPTDDEPPQLLTTDEEGDFRARWQEIQNRFVDDPREAVHAADTLVADLMQTLASTFSQHKQGLETQWNRGEEANTEDLRMALRKYRSFFNRLLSS